MRQFYVYGLLFAAVVTTLRWLRLGIVSLLVKLRLELVPSLLIPFSDFLEEESTLAA